MADVDMDFSNDVDDYYYNYADMDGELMDYTDDMGDTAPIFTPAQTFVETLTQCTVPSVRSAGDLLLRAIVVTTLYHYLRLLAAPQSQWRHLLAVACGLAILTVFHATGEILPFLAYVSVLYARVKMKWAQPTALAITSTILVLCEIFSPHPERLRGLLMIGTMKIISLAWRSHSSNPEQQVPSNFVAYMGYMLCPGNVIMGPWIKYTDYVKGVTHNINAEYFISVIRSLLASSFFLVTSNCWAPYFIPDTSNTWLLAYRKALQFRTSHYFVCFAAEATMLSAGYHSTDGSVNKWRFPITNPLSIEWPRSLVTVVIAWNIPFHQFLKVYVYKDLMRTRGPFLALFITYFVSSLLHGLNVSLSVVLLSLGIFSYVQMNAYAAISRRFDACLLARPCAPPCGRHRRTAQNRCSVVLTQWLSGVAVTIALLAYLGVLMDGAEESRLDGQAASARIWAHWSELYFSGHLILLVLTLCCML